MGGANHEVSSSRKPERSEGYPGPIGRSIVERGPVLMLTRILRR
jgi:hypothetical protein